MTHRDRVYKIRLKIVYMSVSVKCKQCFPTQFLSPLSITFDYNSKTQLDHVFPFPKSWFLIEVFIHQLIDAVESIWKDLQIECQVSAKPEHLFVNRFSRKQTIPWKIKLIIASFRSYYYALRFHKVNVSDLSVWINVKGKCITKIVE